MKTCSLAEWIVHHQTNNRIDLSSRLNKLTQSPSSCFQSLVTCEAQIYTPEKFINIYHGIICGSQRQSTHCFSSSLSYCHNTLEACLGFIHLFPYLAFPLACPDPYSSNKQIECKISNRKNIRIQKINEGNLKLKQDVSILLFMPIWHKLRAVVS